MSPSPAQACRVCRIIGVDACGPCYPGNKSPLPGLAGWPGGCLPSIGASSGMDPLTQPTCPVEAWPAGSSQPPW